MSTIDASPVSGSSMKRGLPTSHTGLYLAEML